MSSEPLELKDKSQTEYYARWEAVETVKAQELAAMTEERAWQIIRSLRPFTSLGETLRTEWGWSNSRPSFTAASPHERAGGTLARGCGARNPVAAQWLAILRKLESRAGIARASAVLQTAA